MPPTSTRPSVRPKGHLLRILGVGFGIAVIVGGAIGSGILRTPGLVASQLGSPRLIIAVWLMGGIYAFCCTLSVIELGTMLPRAGGWYVYSRRAFGEYAGFLVGCIDWIAQPVETVGLRVRKRSVLGTALTVCEGQYRTWTLFLQRFGPFPDRRSFARVGRPELGSFPQQFY